MFSPQHFPILFFLIRYPRLSILPATSIVYASGKGKRLCSVRLREPACLLGTGLIVLGSFRQFAFYHISLF
jgi:hypothetical protein